MKFNTSSVNVHSILLKNYSCVYYAGKELSSKVEKDNLKYVLVLSDGQQVNGTSCVLHNQTMTITTISEKQ